MRIDDARFLFQYDRWATHKVLAAASGVPMEDWEESNRIDRRGLGGILIHALGAHERWRSGWQDAPIGRRLEQEEMMGPAELAEAWLAEWVLLDGYLAGLTDGDLERDLDGIPLWQTMAHLVNHGTQHRSEAAALLTSFGRSPGDLDLIDFAEQGPPG
ncbi:MAG: DinB family protein [Candidatus Limnocylindrales bacterium]